MRLFKTFPLILTIAFILSLLSSAFADDNRFLPLKPSQNLPPLNLRMPVDVLKETTGVDASADSFEYVGDNLIARGHVYVHKGEVTVYADTAIVNSKTNNVELAGNVKFYTLYRTRGELEYWELKQLQSLPNTKVKVVGTVMTMSGRQKLVVDVLRRELAWIGERAAGNLKTGIFEFTSFVSEFGNWYVLGDKGRRDADGRIVLRDSVGAPSESITEGHSIFSVWSGKLVALPPSGSFPEGRNIQQITPKERDFNYYSFWGYNNVLYIGSVPVLWLPVIYKPAKGEQGNWAVHPGTSADWGAYVLTTNHWKIVNNEDVSLSLSNMFDYYQIRGWAVGNQTILDTKDTKTEFLVYGLYDNNTNKGKPDFSRFALPDHMFRYGLQLSNVTDITDRMSFRGYFAKLSDLYFLYDYFYDQARTNPQPATFGSLNYQFNNFSVNLAARPRLNSFFSVVEELPRLDITIPRQELFENIFYQSETSIGYYNMLWTNYKISRVQAGLGNNGPNDYGSFRFDSLHFAYYPIKLDWLNVIPRAGLRLTAYSNSSNTPITTDDIEAMIAANEPEGKFSGTLKSYDNGGGGKFRLIPEFGVQLNTKISRSWDDVKNAYFDFNGFRHVMKPYIDYTYIMPPTVNRNNLYYFDDVDRIDTQNFVRLGFENRLQTRRGDWNSSQVYTWATLENYLDIIFHERDDKVGWRRFFGDFGTKLKLNPTDNLSFTTEILIDPAALSGHDLLKAVDKASFSVNWKFAENWGISGSYYYSNARLSPAPYSMGSSLAAIQSGSIFQRSFTNSSYVNFTLDSQINERTAAYAKFEYDFNQGLMPNLEFGIIRALPCGLEGLLSIGFERQNNSNGTGSYFKPPSINGGIGFSSSGRYSITPRERLLPESIRRTTLP